MRTSSDDRSREAPPPASAALPADHRVRVTAGAISLAVSVVLLAAKFHAYRLTGSSAVLSDALESIVNVVAAVFGLWSIVFGGRPADRNHPYGHGKSEFLSAAFEGGLIAAAAILILYEAVMAFVRGPIVRNIDVGLAIVVGAGLCNLVLGVFLVRTGKRASSLALVADGAHVLSDFWTSAGIALGLGLVRVTGIVWLDPLAAALVALQLFRTGYGVVRRAAGGLLDEEDPQFLERFLASLRPRLGGGVIRVHHLRAIRVGRSHHVDAHLVLPEFWSVERAHEVSEELGARLLGDLRLEGDIVFHADPCRRAYCATCDLAECPVRREPYSGMRPLTLEEAVQPDLPG